MLEASENAGAGATRALGVHRSGIELAALSGREGLWAILVVQDEFTVENEDPG